MKRIFKSILLIAVFLSSLDIYAVSMKDKIDSYINVYQENIFEFEHNFVTINSLEELKLKTNLEINSKNITWTSSDEKIAVFVGNKLQPVNDGKVIITAEYLPFNMKATCIVNIEMTLEVPSIQISTNTYNSLKITYSKQNKATHYEIQRAKNNGKYKTIAITSSTSYIDKKLDSGVTYFYRVRAINKQDNIKSEYSAIKSKKVVPGKVQIISKKVKSYNTTYIKWEKVSGASGYRIYRATSKDGKYELLKTTTSTSYTDKKLKSGKTYYYKIRAYRTVNGTKVFGAYCEIFSLKPVLGRANIKAIQSGDQINIKINKVKDATGYEIYKLDNLDGQYKKLATIKETEYADKKIKYTNSYYYKVRAYKVVNGKKTYGSYSELVNVSTIVPTITVKITREENDKIKIAWKKMNGCSGYELYISQNGKEYNLLKDITNYKTEKYTKSNLELNKKYYIKAKSYKIINGEKVYSNDSKVASCELNQFLQALKLKSNYNVRNKASGSYSIIGTVKKNQIVVSYGKEGNYYKIKLNNKFGYVHKNYVSKYNDAKVLGVSNINQFSYQGGKPLPMGCEVTSLAVVLKYLGFTNVTKNILADKYQPMGKVGKTDPNVAFVGTPYSSRPYGCYAPVIVKTANNYFKAMNNDKYQVNNLTGINIEDLYKEIDKGNPLIMWITYGQPYYQESWTLKYGTKTTKEGTGQYKFTWYGLQHCVAVAGYNKKKNTLIIADVGQSGELTEYSISYLKAGYNKLGKQIVSITEK